MKTRVALLLVVALSFVGYVIAEEPKMMHAKGSFEVKLAPQSLSDAGTAANIGRMSIDKIFTGDLDAKSSGEMLMAQSATEGSAGYVAIERVTGRLLGKEGTFLLQHSGLLSRGEASLVVMVVPDSGTGELQGLKGTMKIDIKGKDHFYTFDYELTK